MTVRLLQGDCRATLPTLEPGQVQSVMTSPPYMGLRDYGTPPLVWGQTCCDHPHEWANVELRQFTAPPGTAKQASNKGASAVVGRSAFCQHVHDWGIPSIVRAAGYEVGEKARWNHRENGRGEAQERILAKEPGWTRKDVVQGSTCTCGAWLGSLGLEPTAELYIEHLVECFRHVRRVLREDGTLWLNLGDSYAGSGKGPTGHNGIGNHDTRQGFVGTSQRSHSESEVLGLKPKDLMMMPARVAMALQADGWYLRSMIPWLKRNSMPESVTDRPSSSLEYVFLLSKSRTYFWDADAVRMSAPYGRREISGGSMWAGQMRADPRDKREGGKHGTTGAQVNGTRNRRNSDWFFESWQGLMCDEDGDPLAFVVNPQPFSGSHFATFPPKLVEPMILASTSEKGQCPECGAPWVRVTSELDDNPTQPVGWRPSCACRISRCPACDVVASTSGTEASTVPPVSDVPGRVSAVEEGHDLLLQDVLAGTDADESLRDVRASVPAGPSLAPVLQHPLLEPQYSIETAGEDPEQSRIRDGVVARAPVQAEERLRVRASAGNGAPDGTGSAPGRGRASPQRRQDGQPGREPGIDGEARARPNAETDVHDDVPQLPARVSNEGECARCGGRLESAPPAPVPQVVLDIFGGAGTVGLVADRLGRNAVLCELKPEYAEMGSARIVGDAPLFADVDGGGRERAG